MRAALRAIVLYCCVLCNGPACGQIEGNIIEASVQNKNTPFTVIAYATKDGLPQNQITHILRKKTGELILHSSNGIVEFNGYRFKPVTTDKHYKKQIFKSLHYFWKQDLLLGHDWKDELYVISPAYREFRIEGAKPMVCLSNSDSMLVISDVGDVYLYNPAKNSTKRLFKNSSSLIAESYTFPESAVIKGKNIYLAVQAGIFCIDLEQQIATSISDRNCHLLKLNPYNGEVYAVLSGGIALVKHNRLENIRDLKKGLTYNRTLDLLFSDSSSFYMATDNGLIYAKPDSVIQYTKEDGLPSYYLHTLLYDQQNQCIFAGSAEKGLLKLQFKNNYSIYPPDGLHKKSVASIISTSKKEILTTAGPSFFRIQEDAKPVYTRGLGEYASLARVDDELYLGTWGEGVLIYKGLALVDSIRAPDRLPDNMVHACFQDSKGRIWIGTDKGIARGSIRQNIKPFLSAKIQEMVVCFYELRDGSICIGSSNGAYILRHDSIIARLNTSNGFSGKEVRAFHEDASGKVWLGTYGSGIFCFENKRFHSIHAMRNCMLYEDAFCIAKDHYGYFYMTSNRGLWRVSESDLNAFYEKKLDYLVPFHYTESSGFLNTEFNGGFQNNFFNAGNYFLFPTIEGLVKTIPEKPLYMPVQATISSIMVNDTLIDKTKNRFERSTYSVQLDFECLNFISKNNVYFQHKLIGETNYEWSFPQKQSSVYLKMLPPGKYTFMVRAIDGFNDRKPHVTAYSFEILPYFYETLWFRVLAVLVLATFIMVLTMMRIASNKRKIEQREYYKRKISEVELNAIQAQLNPHFIFNCMNTIKYFILEKDFTNANDGLNRLSRLIRNSMEDSENMFTPLKQEIIFMTNYIELEKMRLREQLDYAIVISPEVDLSTQVPHLLIQPFIENAIKHGISNLENKQGILRIELSETAEYVICTVTDNGIGRKASEKLLREFPHTSKGTRLALEKSQLLKQYYNYHCNIAITDLYTEKQESEGTRVVISMSKNYYPGNLVSLS